MFEPLFCCSEVKDFAFFNQRTDPITLPPFCHYSAQTLNNFIHTACANQCRPDGFTPGWLLVQNGNIHIAVLCQSKRTRDRRGCHHQNICIAPFFAQLKPLADTKAMLFIDNRNTQVFENHVRLKHSMRSDQYLNVPTLKGCKLCHTVLALIASRQQLKDHTSVLCQGLQPF